MRGRAGAGIRWSFRLPYVGKKKTVIAGEEEQGISRVKDFHEAFECKKENCAGTPGPKKATGHFM